MDKFKLLNKITLMYLFGLIIITVYGYIYLIDPIKKSIDDKTVELSTLKDKVESVKSQIPEKMDKNTIDRAKSLPTTIFDPSVLGYDSTTANAYILDGLLKKVKSTKNKVLEIAFETEAPQGEAHPAVNTPPAAPNAPTINQQLTSLASNGTLATPQATASGMPSIPQPLPIQKTIVKIQMLSTYGSVQNLLEKLYTWKYLAGIKKISIDDQSEDGGILKAIIEVELYIKTGTNTPIMPSSPIATTL
ncbi:MAG: hypothetical protein WCK67_00175 [bacterium]